MHRIKTRRPVHRTLSKASEVESEDDQKAGKSPGKDSVKSGSETDSQFTKTQQYKNILEREKKRDDLRKKHAKKTGVVTSTKPEGESTGEGEELSFWQRVRKSYKPELILPGLMFVAMNIIIKSMTGTPLLFSNTMNMFRPELPHSAFSGPFFEAWYIKSVDQKSGESVIVIPGIYMPHKANNMTYVIEAQTARYKKSQEKKRQEIEKKRESGEDVEDDPILSIDYDDMSQWPEDMYRFMQQDDNSPQSQHHAFVMVSRSSATFDKQPSVLYYRYNISDFVIGDQPIDSGFRFNISNNVFSNTGIHLELTAENLIKPSSFDIADFAKQNLIERAELYPGIEFEKLPDSHYEDLSISGDLTFDNTAPQSSGNFMGPFSYNPFMEYYHTVISQYHSVSGSLVFKEGDVEKKKNAFVGGNGYMDKEWGYNLPRASIWLQTNTFRVERKSSIVISIFDAPIATRSNPFYSFFSVFPGTHSLLNYKAFFVSFYDSATETTHNLSFNKGCRIEKLDMSVERAENPMEAIDIVIKCPWVQKQPSLTVKSRRLLNAGNILLGPSIEFGRMTHLLEEASNGIISVKLEDKTGVLFEDEGIAGGVEVQGNAGYFRK